jgi:hypothetical protein
MARGDAEEVEIRWQLPGRTNRMGPKWNYTNPVGLWEKQILGRKQDVGLY